MSAPGDLLTQIDPRPFEAQLQQAEAGCDRNIALRETAGHLLDDVLREVPTATGSR